MVGDCVNGHRYLKLMLCGKEWCPVCGEKWSWIHQRRYYRMLPKLKVLAKRKGSIGYLVVTIPKEMRALFANTALLNDFRRYIIDFLKRQGYERGVRVWHWAGEDGKTWKPHLNILIGAGYIDKTKLTGWRELFTSWLELKTGLSVPGESIVIKYRYSKVPAKQRHWLRYVVRPTMRVYQPFYAALLKGYHNIGSWGEWTLRDKANDLSDLERNVCPQCKEPLRWSFDRLDSFQDHWSDFERLGAGYWQRKYALPPPRSVPLVSLPVAPRYIPLEFNFIPD